MKKIITNWENDMIDVPEEMITKFVSEKQGYWDFPDNYDLKLMSRLKHRNIEDIYDSLKESRVIIMQPSLFDKEQVIKIVKSISHPIHINNNGAKRDWEIRDFIFLSANPFDDLNMIKEYCYKIKDDHDTGDALTKILHNCEIHFFGFNREHYEMKEYGYSCSDIYAIRYK